jgi:hypothetical protein
MIISRKQFLVTVSAAAAGLVLRPSEARADDFTWREFPKAKTKFRYPAAWVVSTDSLGVLTLKNKDPGHTILLEVTPFTTVHTEDQAKDLTTREIEKRLPSASFPGGRRVFGSANVATKRGTMTGYEQMGGGTTDSHWVGGFLGSWVGTQVGYRWLYLQHPLKKNGPEGGVYMLAVWKGGTGSDTTLPPTPAPLVTVLDSFQPI